MDKRLTLAGNMVAALGILACLVAGTARIGGVYYIAGFQLGTLFLVGTALMVAGLLAKLHAVERALVKQADSASKRG